MLQKLSIFKGKLVVFRIIQVKKLDNSRKKLKTQDKNSRFRQSQKRSLPKTRPKKKPDLDSNSSRFANGKSKTHLKLYPLHISTYLLPTLVR